MIEGRPFVGVIPVSVPCRENGYEDRIKLIRGKLEEVQLPVDKVYKSQMTNLRKVMWIYFAG